MSKWCCNIACTGERSCWCDAMSMPCVGCHIGSMSKWCNIAHTGERSCWCGAVSMSYVGCHIGSMSKWCNIAHTGERSCWNDVMSTPHIGCHTGAMWKWRCNITCTGERSCLCGSPRLGVISCVQSNAAIYSAFIFSSVLYTHIIILWRNDKQPNTSSDLIYLWQDNCLIHLTNVKLSAIDLAK